MMADMGVLTTTINMSGEMATKDSVTTGFQPFCFPDTDTEAYEQRNTEIELMLSGSAHITLADARAISQAKLILPSNESSLQNVCHMQVWVLTFLPGNTLHGHAEFPLPVGHLETLHAARTDAGKGYLPFQVPLY